MRIVGRGSEPQARIFRSADPHPRNAKPVSEVTEDPSKGEPCDQDRPATLFLVPRASPFFGRTTATPGGGRGDAAGWAPGRPRDGWVLFTPSGYYDASPGEGAAAGESLFGWAVNRGPDQADDFYSAARFKDRFHRADVIDRILTTLDEAEAVRLADAAREGG